MTDMTDMTDGGKTAPLKALIADDDPAIVSLLADRLAKMGLSVDTDQRNPIALKGAPYAPGRDNR